MRICLVHEEYPEETNFGGIATYQKNLAEELVRLGNEVYVICRGLKNNQNYVENGVRVIRIFVNCSNQIKYYKKYRKKVAKILKNLQNFDKIDIIEVPDWGAETIYFEKYRKIPLIVRLHTPLKVWLKYNKNNFGKITNLLLKWEEKMLLSADRVTCCSYVLRDIIVKEFPLKKADILVNPNPADTIKFFRDRKIKKENRIIFVGSLEARKGVVVLANALNIFLKKYPDTMIDFIGKDTNRNFYNISTIELIKRIVKKKYQKNINFIGQLKNNDLNYYFNRSMIGVFPSLFDNFPYVVLESMATGLHIVGSRNSGMVEMLQDNNYIYEPPNYKDLAQKMISTYDRALKSNININNITRIKNEYLSTNICTGILNDYKLAKENYFKKKVTKKDLLNVLKTITNEKIIYYKRENSGVANVVYKVKTYSETFIIKKYLYNYNFHLSNTLYDIFENNMISIIRPINSNIIFYNNNYYNVFKYIKSDKNKVTLDSDYFSKIILANKSVEYNDLINENNIIYNRVNFYAKYLENIIKKDLRISIKELYYVLDIYNKIKDLEFIKDTIINHGDISPSNIIVTKKAKYIIDFDETCFANKLYDFSVIAVKFFQQKGLCSKEYKDLTRKIKEKMLIDDKYFKISIQFYLIKILLEKFYLYQIEKIDLFDEEQQKDNYKQYLKLLKYISNSR